MSEADRANDLNSRVESLEGDLARLRGEFDALGESFALWSRAPREFIGGFEALCKSGAFEPARHALNHPASSLIPFDDGG